MNTTVTKTTKKNAVTKTTGKAAAGSNRTPANKSTLKSAAGKLVKSLVQALKPGSKPTAKSATKPVVKNTAAVGRTQKPVSKTGRAAAIAVKPAKKTPATPASRQRAPAATSTRAATAATPAAGTAGRKQPATRKMAQPAIDAKRRPAAQAASQTPRSGVRMRSNKAGAGIPDNIEPIVVSRVSEVATKTSKPTPAVTDDGTLLTEEQIVKMSEKDYMNAAQRAFFKARLQQLEKDLLKNANETTEHLRETVLVPDPADRATIEEEHALELRTRDRERKLLKKVQQSIASIDSGDYGWCEETGEPIGVPRLLARPTATLSLEAQQRRELKQKLYGD